MLPDTERSALRALADYGLALLAKDGMLAHKRRISACRARAGITHGTGGRTLGFLKKCLADNNS